MAHDVFIIYSSSDKPTADAACAALEAAGIRCWIAPRDVLAGTEYGEAIMEALADSLAVVLVYSSHANASPHVRREVEAAGNYELPIIPLRVQNVRPTGSLAYFLQSMQWMDALTPPLEQHLGHLAEAVETLLARSARRRAPASAPKPVAEAPSGQDPATWHRGQGAAALKGGDADAAIASYTRSLEINPDSRAARLGRAEAYARKGDTDSAVADYSASLIRRSVAALFGRANAYLAGGDVDDAVKDLKLIIETEPNFAPAHLALAEIRMGIGNYSGAAENCDSALRLDPRLTAAYVHRAEARLRSESGDEGRFTAIVRDCAQAIRRDSSLAAPYRIRGDVYRLRKEYDRALADVNTALGLKPGYAEGYFSRGMIYSDTGATDKALADLSEAVTLNPTHERALQRRGQIHLRNGDADSALADFNEVFRTGAFERSMNEKYLHTYRAAAWAAKGEDDKALEDFDKGHYASDPAFGEYVMSKAAALMRKGKFGEAVREYGSAMDCWSGPGYEKQRALAQYLRGVAWSKDGDPDRAKEDYEQSLQLDPSLAQRPSEEDLRGTLERQVQEKKEAVERARREREQAVAELAREIPDPHKPEPGDSWSDVAAKARALRKAGNVEAALAALKASEVLLGGRDYRASRYLRCSALFTARAKSLGIEGGLFLYEPTRGDRNVFISDWHGGNEHVLLQYNGRPLKDQEDLARALREASPGEPVVIEYLFLVKGRDEFERQTFTLPDGKLGAAFLPV